MSNLKWIFFDLGWTLVDETQAHRARLDATCEQLAQFGRRYSCDELVELCDRSATDFAPSPFRGMLARLNLSRNQIVTIMDAVRYANENEVLYPGVPEILAMLSGQFKLGVIANQSKGTEERLLRWRIRDHFAIVFASAELGFSKPDPRIFAAAQSEAGCKPEEVIMVGDRIDNDIGPAKSRGWKTIRVLQGFSRFQKPRIPEESPDITISTIGELSANHCAPHISRAFTATGRPGDHRALGA